MSEVGNKTVIDTAELRGLAQQTDAINSEISDLRAVLLQVPPKLPMADPFGEVGAYGQADPVGTDLLNQLVDSLQDLQSLLDTDRRNLQAEATQVEIEEGIPPAVAPRRYPADGSAIGAVGAAATAVAAATASSSSQWVGAGAISPTGAFVAAGGHAGATTGGTRLVAPGSSVGEVGNRAATNAAPGGTESTTGSADAGQDPTPLHDLVVEAGHAVVWAANELSAALTGLTAGLDQLASQAFHLAVAIGRELGDDVVSLLSSYEGMWSTDFQLGGFGFPSLLVSILATGPAGVFAGAAASIPGAAVISSVVGSDAILAGGNAVVDASDARSSAPDQPTPPDPPQQH